MPREVLRAPEHDRNRSLGWLAVEWFEHFMVHGPGDIEGEPLKNFPLDDELVEITVDCYALQGSGRRLYDSAFISRAKGRDKSGHAARHVLFEAFGPCRFAGFAEGGETYRFRDFTYTYQPGEPMGRPIVHPVIRCLATEEGQAGNTYDNVYFNLTEGPLAEGLPRDAAGLSRVNLPQGGEIIPSTASNASKDGGKETFVVFDEALALDTPLPTPSGWTTMGGVRVGDMLVGSDGTPTRVVKVTDITEDRQCWRVTFADGSSVVTSDGHLWQTRVCASAAKPQVRTTGQMVRDGRRFRVPRARGVDTPDVSLPIDPYVLGVWLGDGDSNNATITAGDDDIAETASLIEARGYTARYLPSATRAPRLYVSVPDSHRNRFSPARGLLVRLREAGLLGNKHVPAAYLRAGTEQRIALLRGLMDSDGSVSSSGACCFVQTSRVITDAVVELLRSLGQEVVVAWTSDDRSREGGYYRITFTPHNLVPFALQRKVSRVRPVAGRGPDWVSITGIEPVESVPVRCVAVDADDHLFAAGDGWKITHNTHLYTLPELVRMYATVRRNMAKRKAAEPWSLETSTMYAPGENSVAESTHELAQKIIEGKVKRGRLLFDHREAPVDVDITNEGEVLAALREVYGPFADVMDLQRILTEIWDPRNSEADSRRYFFNQRTSSADAWLTEPEWKARRDPFKVVAKGEQITLGFDGSRKRSRGVTDATALIGCRISDGHLWEIAVWEQPDGPAGDDWRVPVAEVEAAVAKAFKDYRVIGFYADPAKWESYVAQWEAAYAARLKVRASRVNPIEWWMTGGRSGLIVRALAQFHTAVIDGEMTHDGSFALTRHVLNARRRSSTSGLQIAKEHPDSPRKIDAAIAAVLAWQARLDAVAGGFGKSKTGVPRRLR